MRSVLTALCLFATTAHAVPAQFTHQGRLLDADALPMDGEATITFRVTDSESGGTALWEDEITVLLTNGFYSAVLGASEDNPLDTEVLAQAPVWLELQLEGEGAMFPRSAVNSVPYAIMASVAEEVSGGPVDASEIAVAGTPVINDAGEWVGPTATVNWADIEDMPEGFIDGIDDDTDTDSDSFAALGVSCIDGDIPVWDGVVGEWVCDFDQDTLAAIDCLDGQLIRWSTDSTGWVCADDVDTMLSEDEVDDMVADNGYAMASEVFSGSFLDLVDVAPGLADGDDDTQLTAEEVDAIVADNGYAMATDIFSGSYTDLTDTPAVFAGTFSDLSGVPADLADGDQDTLDTLDCDAGAIAVQTESGWTCSTILEQMDADEDGIPVWNDCDDSDPEAGSSLADADCDGITTAEDCDDTDPDATTAVGSFTCPVTSCLALTTVSGLTNGNYYIRPTETVATHLFYCDLSGEDATAGSLRLVSSYGAYSSEGSDACGGLDDSDCSPDSSYPTPYYQGAPLEEVSFSWVDATGEAVSNTWLTILQEEISTVDVSAAEHYAHDADSDPQYKIQFTYVDGTTNTADNRGGSNWGGPDVWEEWTAEGQNMMQGGQSPLAPTSHKIPASFDIHHSGGNWGWHIRFTVPVEGTYGLWLR